MAVEWTKVKGSIGFRVVDEMGTGVVEVWPMGFGGKTVWRVWFVGVSQWWEGEALRAFDSVEKAKEYAEAGLPFVELQCLR